MMPTQPKSTFNSARFQEVNDIQDDWKQNTHMLMN